MSALTTAEQAQVAAVEGRLAEERAAIERCRAFEDAPFSDLGERRRGLARLQQQRMDIRSSDTAIIEYLLALVHRLVDEAARREAEPY